MKTRNAVRAVVLDSRRRVLLIEMELRGRRFWITPGGEIEPGETQRAAIARELREELGPIDIEIGDPIWFGEADIPLFGEELIRVRETYFLCRTDAETFTREGWTEGEHETLRALRWWTLDEIRASGETFFPPSFREEAPRILAGETALREIKL